MKRGVSTQADQTRKSIFFELAEEVTLAMGEIKYKQTMLKFVKIIYKTIVVSFAVIDVVFVVRYSSLKLYTI